MLLISGWYLDWLTRDVGLPLHDEAFVLSVAGLFVAVYSGVFISVKCCHLGNGK